MQKLEKEQKRANGRVRQISKRNGESPTTTVTPDVIDSLDQVREILFGEKARQVETNQKNLEREFKDYLSRLEREFNKRFEAQSAALEKRFEKARALLQAESDARQEALEAVQTMLMLQLQEASQALTDSKSDREELAGLFTEVAQQLRKAAGR